MRKRLRTAIPSAHSNFKRRKLLSVRLQDQSIHTERDWLLRLKNGDEKAFAAIYRLYSARLLGRMIVLVKSETLAADLLQETFVRLWNARETIDPDKSFRSYLFCIAENLVVDFFRRAAKDISLRNELFKQAADNYRHVEEAILQKEQQSLLQNAIDALPAQRRQVFQLVKQEQKTYAEVSRLLAISPSTISDHIVKATKFLRNKLESQRLTLFLLCLFPHFF